MKPYKAASPQDTIYRIRTILHQLGIFTIEQHMQSEGMYYSCRVNIDNNDIGKYEIGANGKGMTVEYALASAYAELMERLENRMIIFGVKYATRLFRQRNNQLNVDYITELPFRYFPDETFREISSDELWKLCQCLLPNVAKHKIRQSLGNKIYKMYFADFYNTRTEVVEHLPYHLLRMTANSTGLCAGNVPEEAILQGLYEIFERYALQQIYLQRLTPPTIPFEMFEGTDIAHRLKKLHTEKGWKIEVKDCSLGKGFPVIGLLIIDRKKNRYTFRLGADLSPIIALQRCFTEAFQGADASERYLQPIRLDDNWNLYNEHNQSVVNGMGRFPREIFNSKGSWTFDGFVLKEQNSHKKDLLYIKRWVEECGYTLYVRDNSFLNFPAYHLYIPGLSETDAQIYDVIYCLNSDNDSFFEVKPEFRLHKINISEKKQLIKKLEDSTSKEIRLFLYNSDTFNKMNRQLLIALLCYSVGDYSKAYHHMTYFLEGKEAQGNRQDPYYYCIRDMFYSKSIYNTDDDISNMLSTIYSEQLVHEVLADMADKDNVFKNFPFPTCFCCDKCRIRKHCSYSYILEIEKTIQTHQHKNRIDQCNLQQLFSMTSL